MRCRQKQQKKGIPDIHYLRAALVKPLQLPGLDDLSLPGKDQNLPCDSTGFARYLVLRFYGCGSKATQPSQLWCRQDIWQVKRHKQQPFALCSVETLRDILISAFLPSRSRASLAAAASAQTPAPVFRTKKFKSNLLASSSFKANWTHHDSFYSKLPTGECPPTQWHPHDLLLQFGTGVCQAYLCCASVSPRIPLQILFPVPLFSYISLLTH